MAEEPQFEYSKSVFEKDENGVWTYEPDFNIYNPVHIFGYGTMSEKYAEKEVKRRSKDIADTIAEGKIPTSTQTGLLNEFVRGLRKFRGNIAEAFGKFESEYDEIGEEEEPEKEPEPTYL